MSIYSIYRITNLVNGKVYIGKTISNDTTSRFYKHVWDANHMSKLYLHCSMRKHGVENFVIETIFCVLDGSDSSDMEKQFIVDYDCCSLDGSHKGYNMTRGGEGVSSEQAKLCVQLRLERGTHNFLSQENRRKVSTLVLANVADGTHRLIKENLVDLKCPNCGKEGRGGCMYRWHFANCRLPKSSLLLPQL